MSYKTWLDEYYDEITSDWKKSGRLQSFNSFAYMKFKERKDNE